MMPRIKGSKNKTSMDHDGSSQSESMHISLGGNSSSPEASPDGPKRPPRIRLNAGMNLHVPEALLDRDKFAYRWFAENAIKGGRVDSAKGAYWEHVTAEQGSNVRRPSGQDQMFLMRLEKKYWEEDRELKRARVRATMEQESAIGPGEYAPTTDGKAEGGNAAVTRS